MQVHHTEYVMPESGLLFAKDHLAGRTFVFDVKDPLHPKVTTSFTEILASWQLYNSREVQCGIFRVVG
jgi:hypothetical protein